MNYGMYLSAAGVLTNMHRLDVMANNLANLNTIGFKPDEVAFMARPPERMSPGALSLMGGEPASSQQMLERLGGGQWVSPTTISLKQGALQSSANDLDLAIEGQGFFMVNASVNGEESTRLTRDGRFTLNSDGELVTVAGGHPVLDNREGTITLDRSAKVSIDARGRISQNGDVVATLGFVNIADRTALKKEGDNLLRFDATPNGETAARSAATGSILQHQVENSAVDPIGVLNQLMNASKAAQASATLMQYHDNVLGQVINTYARVA